MEYSEVLLGWLLGIGSLVIAQAIGYYFSKRNLESQQEHSERILRIQLYHGERKKALIQLDELLKKRYKTFREFRDSVESYLDGSSSIFLPATLRDELREEIMDISIFIRKEEQKFEPPEPPPEFFEEEHEEWLRSLSPWEAIDEEAKSRLSGLKSSMRNKIRKYASEE